MFNFAEILSILIGALLSLVFLDGLRRAFRKSNDILRVDLPASIPSENHEVEDSSLSEGFDTPSSPPSSNDNDLDNLNGIYELNSRTNLLVIKLSSNNPIFSYKSLSESFEDYSFSFEEKGFFTFRDFNESILFYLVNGRKPGSFLENINSTDIALVLDPRNSSNPVKGFELLWTLTKLLSKRFGSNILDDNRNSLTKQMVEHMKYEAQEHQRLQIASSG